MIIFHSRIDIRPRQLLRYTYRLLVILIAFYYNDIIIITDRYYKRPIFINLMDVQYHICFSYEIPMGPVRLLECISIVISVFRLLTHHDDIPFIVLFCSLSA